MQSWKPALLDLDAGTTTKQVLTTRQGVLARLKLHRPQALNALSTEMVQAVTSQLTAWLDDDSVQTVTIEGSGDRGLCAGGDVKAVTLEYQAGHPDEAMEFFRQEYKMNALLASYPKSLVSYQDGIVMGGGLGISALGGLRVCTERTRMAMPETIIGFFPDVGMSYLLGKAPGEMGMHLALTGETFGPLDAFYIGFSDVMIESASWPAILAGLAAGEDRGAVYRNAPDVIPASPLAAQSGWIDLAYSADTVGQIANRLELSSSTEATKALEALRQRSPLSVAVTHELVRLARKTDDIDEVLARDEIVAEAMLLRGDFVEGVRARLIDKDNEPRWKHRRFEDVTRHEVAGFFKAGL